VGTTIVAGDNVDILPGNSLPLKNIPAGHAGAQRRAAAGPRRPDRAQRRIGRAGGGAGRRLRLGQDAVGEIRKINVECYATIGQVGNIDHENVSDRQGGRSRWLGIRPHVRGVAMNPVDHPARRR
jgi:large subunit ribosomal protein L2